MKLIICLDDNNGMMFNNRRQSRDSAVVKKIIDMSKDSKLFMTEYSAKIFPEHENIVIFSGEIPMGGQNDLCFAEQNIASLGDFREIYIFRWNRSYPGDVRFEFDLIKEGFFVRSTEDLVGNSHDKITLELYVRGQE